MKYLNLDIIRQQLRIDTTAEDSLLELYGKSAEDTIFNTCGRSYENFIETYGEMPSAIVQASLLLVDLSYQQRNPIGMNSMYVVPYTFELLIMPYIKLTENNNKYNNNGCKNL